MGKDFNRTWGSAVDFSKYHIWSLFFRIKNWFYPLKRFRSVVDTSNYHIWSLCFWIKNCLKNCCCPRKRVRSVVDTSDCSEYHIWSLYFRIKNCFYPLKRVRSVVETSKYHICSFTTLQKSSNNFIKEAVQSSVTLIVGKMESNTPFKSLF